MPSTHIDYIPIHHVPGVRFVQTDINGGTLTGSIDGLKVYGIEVTITEDKGKLLKTNVPLYPFQEEGIRKLTNILFNHTGALLADDMGLGKTRVATHSITAIKGKDDDVLIVCPASVRHQWLKEVYNIGQKTSFYNLGPQSKKEYESEWDGWTKPGKARWAAVSYNLMEKAVTVRKPAILILDEPHNFLQSRGSTYNKALWKVLPHIRYKLALTGTPYLAKPAGLWSILFILLGMRFGRARDFDIRYCNGHQGQWGWDNRGATNMGELSERLKHYMVRRMKSEVMKEMPAVTRIVRWVEGTPTAKAALLNMGHGLHEMAKAQEYTLPEKYGEVVDIASESSGPTVTFTWMKVHADELALLMNKAKLPTIAVHGDWEAGERNKMLQRAADNNLHVVTTYGASSTGLDGLQKFSSDAIFHSINGVPAITLQAIDRLNRIGQTKPVTATFVAMRNSVDELIVDRVINRLDVFGQILSRNKASTSLQDALRASGLDNDKLMDAIFDSLK